MEAWKQEAITVFFQLLGNPNSYQLLLASIIAGILAYFVAFKLFAPVMGVKRSSLFIITLMLILTITTVILAIVTTNLYLFELVSGKNARLAMQLIVASPSLALILLPLQFIIQGTSNL
ncbi:MAG: hypothetical protein GX811_07885, partial [Lentisphaerae bacterium]|nr:hypothetical protein [Lentisphaerota bacterium]